MFKKMDRETFWGGIFGVVAVVAAIVEMLLSGVDAPALFGMIKDVFGTLVVIVLFIAVLKDNRKIVYTDFEKAFTARMTDVEKKYCPLLCRDESVQKRYNIASKLSSIYDNNVGQYRTFFDYTENSLTFSVKKEIFMGRSKESFDTLQAKIIGDICSNIEKAFDFVESAERVKDKFTIQVTKAKTAEDEAENMAAVVERVILLYVAESEK